MKNLLNFLFSKGFNLNKYYLCCLTFKKTDYYERQ